MCCSSLFSCYWTWKGWILILSNYDMYITVFVSIYGPEMLIALNSNGFGDSLNSDIGFCLDIWPLQTIKCTWFKAFALYKHLWTVETLSHCIVYTSSSYVLGMVRIVRQVQNSWHSGHMYELLKCSMNWRELDKWSIWSIIKLHAEECDWLCNTCSSNFLKSISKTGCFSRPNVHLSCCPQCS